LIVIPKEQLLLAMKGEKLLMVSRAQRKKKNRPPVSAVASSLEKIGR